MHRLGSLVQGIVFAVVGVCLLWSFDERHAFEAIATLVVVFAGSVLGFVLAWREGRAERRAPRRARSRRYSGRAADAWPDGE